jgi:hypothetical protein
VPELARIVHEAAPGLGRRFATPEQGFFGLRWLADPAGEDHLEGAVQSRLQRFFRAAGSPTRALIASGVPAPLQQSHLL